jgi:hypothetical protein
LVYNLLRMFVVLLLSKKSFLGLGSANNDFRLNILSLGLGLGFDFLSLGLGIGCSFEELNNAAIELHSILLDKKFVYFFKRKKLINR